MDTKRKFRKKKITKASISQMIAFLILRLSAVVVIAALVYILYDIISKGISVINWEFLTTNPRNGMTEGGIFPAILGTLTVSIVTMVFSVPLGICGAIYLNEYAKAGLFTRIIRLALRNLAGVPSIVFGLFGVAFFIQIMGLRPSILAASLTLALLTLPVTLTASEEALKTVPDSYREASQSMGATKWTMIRTIVLPLAVPGMMTGAILGLARAAGETAPILFTGAAFFLPSLPKSITSQFMALPYHLYIMATQHHDISKVRPIAYGTALVLVGMVVILNMFASTIRSHYRKKFRK